MMMNRKMKNTGIYIHIPFCRSKCPYCDFFSLTNTQKARNYMESVNQHIALEGERNLCKVDTLYIGGGTPSVVDAELLAAAVKKVRECFKCELKEVTVECNPSDSESKFFDIIASSGVNRISFGMQSAVESERKALGRRADAEKVKQAVKSAREAGIKNISLDLMIGIPNQTKDSLLKSIDFCAETEVQHISAYMLKLEKGTYFYNHADRLNLPDEDTTADLYLYTVEKAEELGFKQYEISNFAKEGYESLHNLKYWLLDDYIGIGAAAHSFIGSKRFYYPRDTDYFISGGQMIFEGNGGDTSERIMLGLRLKRGIDL
jgi:oxygen-independent coproporphyrinogen-3 oxidase